MFDRLLKSLSITLLLFALCGCAVTPTTSPQATPTLTPNIPSSPQPVTNQPTTDTPSSAPAPASPAETPKSAQTALQFSGEVIAALQARDLKQLANLADPKAGIRFSPYAHIDIQHDVVFTPDQLRKLSLDSKTTYIWGTFDGSGMEMKLTFAEYYKRFVYDRDFAMIGQVAVNKTIKTGNTVVNIQEAYPKAAFVEYHVPGTVSEGMDWSSLRLILTQDGGGNWHLSGISHDQWTI